MHAIGRCFLLDLLQLRDLLATGGHNQLAAAAVFHIFFCAVGIQQFLALHAQPRLERVFGVVDAGMNHLAVARAGARANGIGRLQHNHLAA